MSLRLPGIQYLLHGLLLFHHSLHNRQCLREVFKQDVLDSFSPAIRREVVVSTILLLDEEYVGVCCR